MISVYIPSSMRELTGGQALLQSQGQNIAQLFTELEGRWPGLNARLFDPNGQVNQYIAVFVNGQSIRDLQSLETPLQDRDEVQIIPAIAGG